MRLTTTRGDHIWTFPSGASLTYHRASSLDIEVAQTMASEYGAAVLKGEDILADFGMMPDSLDGIIQSLSRGHDDITGFATRFYAVALAERLVTKIEGFELDEVPAELTRAFLATLLADPDTQNTWLQLAVKPLHDQAAAGNGSAPALNISSAGAKKTAVTAKPSVPPARTGD